MDGVTCLAWLGGSRFLATGCMDGKVRIWNSLSGECKNLQWPLCWCSRSLSVSANGDFLVSASYDGTARGFEIAEYR